jgi:riboflavin-specific deaminase-like protein
MSATPKPTELNRLLPAPPARLNAAQIVEDMRLWEAAPVHAPDLGLKRPRVFLNMACTADGRIAVRGRSGPIGNNGDRELFHALRTAVDAVLVGAGTVRTERYSRLVREESAQRLRRARGLAAEPLVCVVSASLALSPELPLLRDPAARVAILTPSATGELPTRPVAAASATPVEYVRANHRGLLDLPAALAELHTRLGVRTVMCEGGPHLNGQLFAAGLVDELFLSLAPKLAGGPEPAVPPTGTPPHGATEPSRSGTHGGSTGRGVPAPGTLTAADQRASLRLIFGPELDPPVELELLGAIESESHLLLRYRVGGAGGAR